MPRIGVAVAGCGEWGRHHVRALASLPGARLLHVADPDASRRGVAAELAPEAAIADSIAPALADPRVGALVVCAPSPFHAPLARAALDAKKHVSSRSRSRRRWRRRRIWSRARSGRSAC